MSADLARPAPRGGATALPGPAVAGAGRLLRALPARAARMGRLPFAIVVVALLVAGLASALVLNTVIQADSKTLSERQAVVAELSHQEAALQGEVQTLRSPEHLQQEAAALGMVPNPYPAFVDLRTGKVVGKARAVEGGEVPGLLGSDAQPTLATSRDGASAGAEGR